MFALLKHKIVKKIHISTIKNSYFQNLKCKINASFNQLSQIKKGLRHFKTFAL